MHVFDFLARIPEFRGATQVELQGLARSSQIFSMPANRWLVQSERNLGAYFYLLKGKVETWPPRPRLKEVRYQHFYPGCERARTRTRCQILRLDAAHRELIFSRRAAYAVESHAESQSSWIAKFLQSHMMSKLTTPEWQSVFRHSRQMEFAAGETVLQQGRPGADFHVVETGVGRIHRGNRTLKQAGPGDFFGEDAIVSGRVRNAQVTAMTPMRTHAIKGTAFLELVVPKGVTFGVQLSGKTPLSLDGVRRVGGILIAPETLRERIRYFDQEKTYCVVGGDKRDRVMCAFLLSQWGIRADVLALE